MSEIQVLRIEWPNVADLPLLVELDIAHEIVDGNLVVHLVNGQDITLKPGSVLEIEI